MFYSLIEKIFPVPNHGGKEISPGVEKKILEIIGMSREDFDKIK